MFRPSQRSIWIRNSCADSFPSYGSIIAASLQARRSVLLKLCRYQSANFNSRNYYDLLGVKRNATQKEIKQAFFKLSKEYHPDANGGDKSLHEKFVKINEAFSVLSKPSTRTNYDLSLNSLSRPPYQTYPGSRSSYPSGNWSNSNAGPRSGFQYQNYPHWQSYSEKAFYDSLRRKTEQNRQGSDGSPFAGGPNSYYYKNYFGSISIIMIIVGLGIFLHALQWRMLVYSNAQHTVDPRLRHYYAYREWQRLSQVKEAELNEKSQDSSKPKHDEEQSLILD